MVDIAVIGAGPAGLSAALNARARNKTVKLFSGDENYLNRAELVDNYLGFHEISGSELMDNFLSHLKSLGIVPEKGKITNIVPFGGQFMLNLDGEIIESKAVILATGVIKVNEIKGEEKFLGKGVSYCATCDGQLFKNKSVFVFGLSKNAAEEANFLKSLGVDVTFVSEEKFMHGLRSDIKTIVGKITEIIGNDKVETVILNSQKFKTDGVFILRSSIAPDKLIDGLKTEDAYIKVDKNMKTNIPGVFAAGDCAGRPLQVAKAVGEGLVAAQEAAKFIDKK